MRSPALPPFGVSRVLPRTSSATSRPARFAGETAFPSSTPKGRKIGWKTIQPNLFDPLPQITPPNDPLRRFAVIGDAGTGLPPQFAIAKEMMNVYQTRPFASVLVLGDNVYEHGEPELFDKVIEAPYKDLLNAGVRFYPAMGNHDVRNGFEYQQMAYWGAPRFYSRRLGNTEIFCLDTTVFLPGYDGCYKNNPHLALQQAKDELYWLHQALAKSTAKYKVVYGHYPIYTSGMHAGRDDSLLKLRRILEPVLVEHGVDLYLAGHDHHYEKSFPVLNNQVDPQNGVRHIVSGAAGQLRPNVFYRDNPVYPREKLVPKRHFMLFEETPVGLKYDAVTETGEVIDTGLIPPHRRSQPLSQYA